MVIVLIVYLLFIFILFGVVAFLIRRNLNKNSYNDDKIFYDEDGNHRYYERSLIEKLYVVRNQLDCGPIRSIRRLFFSKF